MISSFDEIYSLLKEKPSKRLVAAFANDSHTIGAVSMAIDAKIVQATLVGDSAIIEKVCKEENIDFKKFKIVHEPDETTATMKAVEMVSKGEGDILMKGLCSTDKYMRAILNKEIGLLPPKGILSHVTVMQAKNYHKLLILGDIAVIPAPDLQQKQALCNYLISTAKALGIKTPKVAIVAATEQMSPNMQACVDAAILAKMGERGQLKAIIEGPLGIDIAVDKEAAEIKKINSPVAADADCLLFPNLEAGNVFYKTMAKFADGTKIAAVVAGTKAPCVLSSRGDSSETKLNSIALAALLSI